jgi:E3 ubiquitin-protein ligase HECTD1
MRAQGFTFDSCFRIGLLPGSRRANMTEDDVMMSSYISEESEKELELDPPKPNPEDSKPW